VFHGQLLWPGAIALRISEQALPNASKQKG
jgi:hypothetical protein